MVAFLSGSNCQIENAGSIPIFFFMQIESYGVYEVIGIPFVEGCLLLLALIAIKAIIDSVKSDKIEVDK